MLEWQRQLLLKKQIMSLFESIINKNRYWHIFCNYWPLYWTYFQNTYFFFLFYLQLWTYQLFLSTVVCQLHCKYFSQLLTGRNFSSLFTWVKNVFKAVLLVFSNFFFKIPKTSPTSSKTVLNWDLCFDFFHFFNSFWKKKMNKKNITFK